MARRRDEPETPARRLAEATTLEGREAQVGAAAMSLAEEQILSGVASSQVIVHFLKATSPREQLERENLRADIALRHARVEQIESQQRIEELMEGAIRAVTGYQGRQYVEVDDDHAELQ